MKTLPIFYEEKPAANVSFDSHGFPELEYNESWQPCITYIASAHM